MTELVITNVPDTWVNGGAGRTGTNYASTNAVQLLTGERRAFLLPDLGNIAGRTVLDAYLVGRARTSLAAQTITVTPVTERWSPGRVTWANQPDVAGGTGVGTAVSSGGAGATVELTGLATMIQAVADGTDWYGVRLGTSISSSQGFYSTDSGEPAWELHITLSDVADPPTGLRPDGGADQGSTSPILAWDPIDDQTEVRVQVDTPAAGVDPDDVTPDYDSGWVPSGDPQFDLAGEHTLSGAGPHYWRIQAETEGGMEPTWSDWAEFGYRVMPAFVLDSPTGPFGDVQPTIIGHMTGETMTWWKLTVTGPDRSDVRYTTGVRTGDMEQTVPFRNKAGKRILKEGSSGWLRVQAGGEYDRAVTVGQSGYINEWFELDVSEDDGAIDAPTGLTVRQYADGDPRLVWEWYRTEAADDWVIQVDGVTVARPDGDEDIEVDSGRYTFVDSGEVSPMRPHTLGVRAVDGEGRSAAATVTDHVHYVKGMWLLPEDEDPIVLDGTAVGGFARSDAVASYTTLPGEQVDVFYGHPGMTDAFTGSVDRRDPDLWGTLDRLETLKTAKRRQVRMVWASHSILVNLRDVHALAADDILPSNPIHNVVFGFSQVGE